MPEKCNQGRPIAGQETTIGEENQLSCGGADRHCALYMKNACKKDQ